MSSGCREPSLSGCASRRCLSIAFVRSVIALSACFHLPTAHSIPGDLDPRFNLGARTFFQDAKGTVAFAAQVPGSSATLVVISDESPRAQRLNALGKIDPFYGRAGIASLPRGGFVAAASDREGRLVILLDRSERPFLPKFVLARFDASGRVDPAFGTGGIAELTLPEPAKYASARFQRVTIGDDGAILVGAVLGARVLVARLDPSGARDTGFGSNGLTALDPVLTGPFGLFVIGLSTLPGRAVVVAARGNGRGARSSVFRLDAAGQVDRGFGRDGVVELPLAIDAADVSSAGEIVLAGLSTLDAEYFSKSTNVVRLDATGQPKARFGVEGRVLLPRGESYASKDRPGAARFVAFDSALPDHVIVGGHTWSRASGRTGWSVLIERLGPDGRLDTAFGVGGAVEVELGYDGDSFVAFAQGDAADGFSITVAGSGDFRPAIRRLLGGPGDTGAGTASLSVVNSANNSSRIAPGTLITLYYPRINLPPGCDDGTGCGAVEIVVDHDVPDSLARRLTTVRPGFLGATQANLVLPEVVSGSRSAFIRLLDRATRNVLAEKLIGIDPVAPALFTENGTGLVTPSAQVLRVKGAEQTLERVTFDEPIALTGSDEIYLILYGTGIRRSNEVRANLRYPVYSTGWVRALTVTFAGPQGLDGLDQINIRLPVEALKAGQVRGTVSVEIEVSVPELGPLSLRSNPVEIAFDF